MGQPERHPIPSGISLEQLAAAVASIDAGVLICDRSLPDTPIVFANEAFSRITGYHREEVLGRNCRFLQGKDTDPAAVARLRTGIKRGQPVDMELLNYRKDGGSFWNALRIAPVADGGEPSRFLVGIQHDVTQRRRAEEALREREGRFRSIGDSVPVIVWVTDPNGSCTYVNRRWYEYTGQADGEGEGSGWLACVHPHDLAATSSEMVAAIERREPFRIEYRLRRHDGAWRWMLDAGAPQINGRGTYLGYVGSIVDIDERRLAEARVHHLAHHDPLTGLPNRALFHDRLQQALAQASRYDEQVGLLLLDLDRFKDVNDVLGHDAGDVLLREVASRLRACVRTSDTVARLGGDEFAIVLPRLTAPGVAAEVAVKIIAALGEPVAYGDDLIHSGASVGITVFPADGDQPVQMPENADIALYRAKAEGRGGYCFFMAEMRDQTERRKELEDELRLAIARGEIVPFYQPKVRLGDGRVIGLEALARWRHPERGVVMPSEFLPAAEEAGLSGRLDETVLWQALAQIRAWRQQRLPIGYVAVNVAGVQLRRGGLAAKVKNALADTGAAPRQLMIEITESVFLGRGADRAAEELRALHALGVLVALDDFGTGYASLTHLKRFPVGVLKIDQSFVRDMLVDPGDAAIVRAVVSLAHSLGMKVTAGGVETPEQAEWLQLQGCDCAQGYLFGRPMPPESVPDWLRQRRFRMRPQPAGWSDHRNARSYNG